MGDETSLRYESGFSLTEAQKHRTLGMTEAAFGIANRTNIDSPKNTKPSKALSQFVTVSGRLTIDSLGPRDVYCTSMQVRFVNFAKS